MLPAGRPGYVSLAAALRGLILDGRLPLAARLPAERELAAGLGLSRTTTTAAYRLLRQDGYAESRRGAGTFAALPIGGGGPLPAWAPAPAGRAPLIDLTVAAPPAPRELLATAAEEAVGQLPLHLRSHGYDVFGLGRLRDAIAERYARRGLPTSADQILITSGAQGAISLLAQVLLAPGAVALVESPTYPNALDAFRAAGARLVTVPVSDHGWELDLLESGFRQTLPRLAYLIPDFHNPTGHRMPSRLRAAVAGAARTVDAFVVADESFLGLHLDDGGGDAEPLAAHDPERVVSVGSLSKAVWGGLRVGWIRAETSLVQRLAAARPALDLTSPILEQLIALQLVDRLDDLLADRRRAFARQLDALIAALEAELPAWRFRRPDGGLSLWVELDASSTALARAAEAEDVRIAPGPRFGTGGTLERYLRLPFVLPETELVEAVRRLARAREAVPSLDASDRERPVRVV
jgi:DNA-binding transcriptional MocR family regulator